jgi:2-acylglycerol O-acyltransferase 2
VRFPRSEEPLPCALQFVTALFFASYFFFAPLAVFALLMAVGCGFLSFTFGCGLLGAYFLQLLLYRPHLGKGWPFEWFLYSPFVDWVLRYHDATVVRLGPPPDPTKRYLFTMYPHGLYGVCRAFSGGVDCWRHIFPGITARWGSFGMAFYWPGVREFSLSCGCLDASKPILQKAIKRGENVFLLPGGIAEMMLTDETSTVTKLVMKERKGFVRLAVENGMYVVPGFCFGEKRIHKTVHFPDSIKKFLRRFGLAGTILKGRGFSFLGFLGVKLGYVYCEPIRVKRLAPSDAGYEAEVNRVHREVVSAVERVFVEYKEAFGYGEEETLELV